MAQPTALTVSIRLLFILIGIGGIHVHGQLQTEYTLDVQLLDQSNSLAIQQEIQIYNAGKTTLDTLYFNDWPSAFRDTDTPLSQRLAEEFDRSFYLSNASKLGATNELQITLNGASLKYRRLPEQPDILKVALGQPLGQGQTLQLQLQYKVKVPSARFTGYGVSGNGKTYDLRHWYIALSPYTKAGWKKYSNLNLDDASLLPSNYKLSIQYPPTYTLFSNLKTNETAPLNGSLKTEAVGNYVREARVVLQQKPNYFLLKTSDGFELITNIKEADNTVSQLNVNFERIYQFITDKLGPPKHKKQLVALKEYNKNPFYGLSQLPSILSPFDSAFENEIKLLKAFANNYIDSNLILDQRNEHWIIEGLHVYLAIKYMETFYPDKKFVGRLQTMKLLQPYAVSKLSFNQGFQVFAEQMLRANNYQPLNTPKIDLIRFNERIGSPYMAGLAFRYLESYIGTDAFEKVLKNILPLTSAAEVEALIQAASPKDIRGFFTIYLKKNRPLDLKLKRLSSTESNYRFEIQRQGFEALPLKLDYLKNKKTTKTQWLAPNTTVLNIPKTVEADYIAINTALGLPEVNKRNNRVAVYKKRTRNPLKFTFIKDIEDPQFTQVFYNPLTGFNLYDGLSFGVRLNNKKIGIQRFNFDFRPQYSSYENTLVGSFATTYRHFQYDKKHYLTLYNVFGNTFHYATNKRYYVIAPNVSFLFRPRYLRSNKVQALTFSLYKVEKFGSITASETPEYSVFKTQYQYANKGSINYFTANTGVEVAQNFSKLDATLDYRKLFRSGRQLQIRTFAGVFLDNNTGPTSYFDFNLNRPNDYLFQYDFFGRSESTGLYGQQFVMAEGGFKSIIPNSNANQWMLSANLTFGLWRWIEVYLDGALLKNKGEGVAQYYDTGLRFNLLPDYLELFFPVASTSEVALTSPYYTSKIRFVLSIRGNQLKALFSRSWF